jgi:hypothetical protein
VFCFALVWYALLFCCVALCVAGGMGGVVLRDDADSIIG